MRDFEGRIQWQLAVFGFMLGLAFCGGVETCGHRTYHDGAIDHARGKVVVSYSVDKDTTWQVQKVNTP